LGPSGLDIDYTELSFDAEIGKGAYGVVYKGRWREGVVAIKKLLLPSAMNEREMEDFRREAALMKNLRPHVNVVQFLGITSSPHPLCIVTEFMEHGSLYSFIHSENKVDTNLLVNLIKGIAAGMLHLHKEGIVHRDLACRNVLLGSGFQVKISDFGLSRVSDTGDTKKSNQTKSDTGPLKWMAPESIRYKEYSQASDIWSFGVVIWEIVSRSDPYPDLDPVQTALEVTTGGRRLEPPAHTPPILKQLMQNCFQTEPTKRPDFKTMCAWLQNSSLQDWVVSTNPLPQTTPSEYESMPKT